MQVMLCCGVENFILWIMPAYLQQDQSCTVLQALP